MKLELIESFLSFWFSTGKGIFLKRKVGEKVKKRKWTYGITSGVDGLDGGAETVGGDRKVLDKVVEELPVLTSVELLGLGVPDGGVCSRGGHFVGKGGVVYRSEE
jgi:hypothetical protein